MEKLVESPCVEFIQKLSSGSPIPGGGGAAALTGSIGASLAGMVGNLTVGKKKYASFEPEVVELMKRAKSIEERMLEMVDEDAEYFLPLSKAYGMKAVTEEAIKNKKKVMEKALKEACIIPMEILRSSLDGIHIHKELVDKCSTLAISDIGVGVQCFRSALVGAHLNVCINLQLIEDTDFVNNLSKEAELALSIGIELADYVYRKVINYIKA